MRAIVIFATLTAVVLARPDVSHLGYKYQQPSGGAIGTGYSSSGSSGNGFSGGNNYAGNGYTDSASFGSSSSSVTAGSGYSNGYSGQGSGSPGNGLSSGISNDFGGSSSGGFSGSSSGGFSGGSSSNGYSGSSSSGFSGSSSNGFSGGNGQAGFGGTAGGVNLIQGQSQSIDLSGGSSGGQRVVYKPVIKQGEPIITKNFYVHAAPEEDENVRVEEKVQVVRPQKTYKIIFIKAPSAGASLNAVNYPVYPQNEEKTIVYVLSKKDEGISDIGEIPTPPPAVTHKPEVFFIKYKTKQEAADAVANIQSQLQAESQASAEAGAGASGTSFNIGGGSSSSGSDVFVASSGSASDGNTFDSRITPDDIRIDDGPIDASSFGSSSVGGDAGSSGIQSYQSSSQSSFGPSGGSINLQSSSFGPSGGQTITQTAQIPANDGQVYSQTTYTENGNGGQAYTQSSQYSSDSSGSSAEFVPQNIIKINADKSAFRQQSYLPPNGCSNC